MVDKGGRSQLSKLDGCDLFISPATRIEVDPTNIVVEAATIETRCALLLRAMDEGA
jgi:hypothetical protein